MAPIGGREKIQKRLLLKSHKDSQRRFYYMVTGVFGLSGIRESVLEIRRERRKDQQKKESIRLEIYDSHLYDAYHIRLLP